MEYKAEKKVKLLEQIRYGLLTSTGVKDKEIAKRIAREWLKR